MNRGERRARTQRVIDRRRRDWDWANRDSPFEVKPRKDGTFRSKHPFDCGKADCGICRDASRSTRRTKGSELEIDEHYHTS